MRVLTRRMKLGVFFGHPFAGLGLFFLLLGGALLGTMAWFSDLGAEPFRKSDPHVSGTMVGRERTGFGIKRSRIYVYDYRYEVHGIAYTGRAYGSDRHAAPGEPVQVHHAAGQPGRSQIEGMRSALFAAHTIWPAGLFPAAGLCMLFVAARRYRRNRLLLQSGVLAYGKVVHKAALKEWVNNRQVYCVRFEFEAADGRVCQAELSTNKPDILGDEALEPLVYDPGQPACAVLLDTLPRAVRRLLTDASSVRRAGY